MIYSVKKLVEAAPVGEWVKITPEEEEALRDSLEAENYRRGSLNQESLRMYFEDGYAVLTTFSINAGTHPTRGIRSPEEKIHS